MCLEPVTQIPSLAIAPDTFAYFEGGGGLWLACLALVRKQRASERINLIKLLTIAMRVAASLNASQNAFRSRLFPELNARLPTETLLISTLQEKKTYLLNF